MNKQTDSPSPRTMHQLWQAVPLKSFKIQRYTSQFWKSPNFICLEPASQDNISALNAWNSLPKVAGFTMGIYLSVSRCKLLFWAMYEWKACSDFFLIGNALQILTCTQQYLSMPLGAVCTTIGYKNHMVACLRYSMFSWSKNSLSLDCLLVPKISKRRFFRDISNSFNEWLKLV